ncbi:ankyrin repeat protein [Ectocarpus siliculosus]|uniref:Ankyrin repeat protein n=1 Tax=Ectocarpus siliculosus TaxID=2880 RepID=D8LME9_ECTSI|nr:ankyrin repeat protein [Ectocarpus siliculosus]|eukprot:CBN77559.1 ankyrin repeat protein [Ectocarpus siliculosus]
MVAAGLGKVSFVEFLVARGAGLDSRTCRDVPRPEGGIILRMGSQAIHAAVHGGSPGVLYVLLRLGANPNAADDDGETPLMIACGDSTKDRFGFAMAS